MLNREITPIPTDSGSAYDCVGTISDRCFPAPEWRHTASLQYDSNEWWSVTARWRFFDGVDYDGTTDTIAKDEMGATQNYFDLSSVFRFMENHDVTVGVNNIFDKEPRWLVAL